MSFKRNTIYLFIANLFQLLFGFAQLIFLSRFIHAKADFGKLQQVNLISTLIVGTIMAISTGMVYFSGSYTSFGNKTTPLIKRFSFSVLLIAILAILFLWGVRQYLADFFKNSFFIEYSTLIAVLLGLRIINTLYPNICLLKEKLHLLVLNNVVQILFFCAFFTFADLNDHFIILKIFWLLIGVELIEFIALSVTVSPSIFYNPLQISSYFLLRKEWNYTGYLLVNAVFMTITGQVDRLIVSRTTNPTAYSDYSIVTFANPIIGIISSSISASFILVIANLYAQGNINEILSLWKRTASKAAVILIPIIMFSIIFGDQLIVLVFGEKFKNAAFLFQLFNCKYLLIFITISATMNAVGLEKFTFFNSLINLLSTAMFVYLGIKIANVEGAVIGGIIAIYLGYLFPFYIVKKKLKSSFKAFFPVKTFLLTVVISLTTGLLLLQCLMFFDLQNKLVIILISPVYYVVNLFIFNKYVFPVFDLHKSVKEQVFSLFKL